jgi:dihydrofolate reductase
MYGESFGLLLGRRTYDGWSGFWPKAPSSPMADRLNAADILFEVINRRYERKSLIVTTNRIFKEWNEVFPNASCIATMLDRLLHHADVTVIGGDSYRVRESEQETAARLRKK